MGIPKFFRWLSDRYPLINQRLDENHEFDHFYLDMNGIIHQCTHPDDDEIVVTNIDEMFKRIFDYTDRLYNIVRPQKLMFLAVDGVAPRAKMNQQRARRFRSAKDAKKALEEAIALNKINLPDGVKPFDSNCITPGTEFMRDLSDRFRAWIADKMSSDPLWRRGCNIIFSGSETPGEGEHKIMEYIRHLRNSPEWDPSIRHCMYGLDADLIMLGLVSHEPHFTLLREKIKWKKNKRKVPNVRKRANNEDEFEMLELALLRDMIYLEFKPHTFDSGMDYRRDRSAPNFDYSVERVVDDFIFMVMLVGNDFIPHIPNLDIAEGALNIMFRIYKDLLPKWQGYLTKGHRLHPDRLEDFIGRVAKTERTFFETRAVEEGDKNFKGSTYREYYYRTKLNADASNFTEITPHIQVYMEGMHWVLHYYHSGCPSWNWYYPYLYAPLASDFRDLRQYKVRFQKGHPFQPLSQLLSVLPPESADLLPKAFSDLMTKKESPLHEFYPSKFDVDPNGKKNAWEAIVLIPFIDEKILLENVAKIDMSQLTNEEQARDKLGKAKVFFARDYVNGKRTVRRASVKENDDGYTSADPLPTRTQSKALEEKKEPRVTKSVGKEKKEKSVRREEAKAEAEIPTRRRRTKSLSGSEQETEAEKHEEQMARRTSRESAATKGDEGRRKSRAGRPKKATKEKSKGMENIDDVE